MPVGLMKSLLISLVALTIVVNIKVVGIILLISLLTVPQSIANQFTRVFSRMIIYSVAISLVGVVSGLLFSYSQDVPSGASIIFALILLFGLTKAVFYLRGKLRPNN